MSQINVSMDATLGKDGSVRCALECDGRKAIITFTSTDVLFDVPEGIAEKKSIVGDDRDRPFDVFERQVQTDIQSHEV